VKRQPLVKRQQVVSVLIGVAAALAGLAVLLTGIELVARRALDPVSAAMVGFLALAIVEGGAVVVSRRRIARIEAGTSAERLIAMAGIGLVSLGIALVVVPVSQPTDASLVVGGAAIVAMVAMVGSLAR
jgi:hypothetical protein